MSVTTKRAIWLGSAVTIAFAGFASVAQADDADAPLNGVKITEGVQVAQAATTPAPAAEEKPEEKKIERVVVTGSRLKKNEFTSSAPIQVITREETTLEGLNDTTDILQGSPLSSGSQQINNTFGGFVTQGGPGANTVSLRGLGAQRTLVLINGRRIAPAGTRGQVGQADLNTIPESMIDRIEILKDGGSSIYGSDAVAGVINIITKKAYEGVALSASGTAPFEGAGEEYQINGTWGEVFERGHFMMTGEYYRRETLTIGDRDYLGCPQDRVTNSAITSSGAPGNISDGGVGSILDIIDPATSQSKCFNSLEGVFDRLVGAFPAGGRFIPDPTAVAGGGPFALDLLGWKRVGLSYVQVANRLFGTSAGASASAVFAALTPAQRTAVESAWRGTQAAVPTNDPRQQETDYISPVTRYSFFGEGSYDLLPGMEGYAELAFVRRESEQHRFRQFFPNVCGAAANGYGIFPALNGAALACTATNANNPFGVLARSIPLIPTDGQQTVDFYRAVLGIRGDLSDKFPIFGNWSYDLYVQHARTEADYTNDIIYNDAVNATTGPGGCNQALILTSGSLCSTLPVNGVNWFRTSLITDGIFTDAERAFLFTKETGHTTFTQTIVNGVVTGDAFNLPAGAVSAALGFEARWDEIDDTPGLQARSNNLWGQTSAGRTFGHDAVKEVFGEVSVPLMAGKSFAESLTLDASARYTSYDSFGEDSTYKVGLNWQITPEYRVRGTTGTSFRAPALFEQFLGNQTGFQGQANIDSCILWNLSGDASIIAACGPGGYNLPANYSAAGYSSAIINTNGSSLLDAERSEARTVGFIWTPDWIDFSVALDYWEFEVNNEVAQFGSANIIFACLTQPPTISPLNPFCALHQRDTNPASPTFGRIISVNNSYVNISSQVSDGLDLTARYEHEFSFGKLLLNFAGTWTFTDEIRTFDAFALNDFNGELYDPDFTGRFNARFDYTDWTFFWAVDMAARSSNDEAGAQFTNGGNLALFRASPFTGVFKQNTEWTATHTASVRYRAADWEVTLGVINLFDEEPPAVSSCTTCFRQGNSVSFGGPYDIEGRRGFLEVTKEF